MTNQMAFDKAIDLMADNSNTTTLSHALFSEENGSTTVLKMDERRPDLRVNFGRYNYSAQDMTILKWIQTISKVLQAGAAPSHHRQTSGQAQ